MRPRFALALVVLIGLLAAPSPAGSASRPQGPPDVHRAGIQPAGPAGVARPSRVPHLVRPGSDRRADAGPQTGSPARTGGPLAPTTLTVYDGVGDQEVVSPGDPTGALGVAYHLAAVNVRMNFFERVTGTALFPQAKRLKSLDTQIPASADDFDPKVVYDPYRQRFVLAFASATSTQSFLSIVVIPEGSEGTTGDWCVLHMSGDQVSGTGASSPTTRCSGSRRTASP